MKLQNNTVLITGGSSGIGLELTKQLLKRGNTILICGRSHERLMEAQNLYPNVHIFKCDVSKVEERILLVEWVKKKFPDCNILINNAAIAHNTNFIDDPAMMVRTEDEIQTNFIAPVSLCKLFIPILLHQQNAAIINITTGLIYSPKVSYPIYNATKAALHSFTQVLRKQLSISRIKVIEVMMPVVNTAWHKGKVPKTAISPEKAVTEMLEQIEKEKEEIRVGAVKILFLLSRITPSLAFKLINRL